MKKKEMKLCQKNEIIRTEFNEIVNRQITTKNMLN